MKKLILTFVASLLLTLTPQVAFSGTAYAACGNGSSSKDKVLQGIGETGSECKEKDLTEVIAGVVRILSFVAGFLAILMIILAGFKYITSGGDSNKVGNAKNTLIYALVGVVVAALAQVMVHFLLFQTNKAVSTRAYPKQLAESAIRLDSPQGL